MYLYIYIYHQLCCYEILCSVHTLYIRLLHDSQMNIKFPYAKLINLCKI
jgi:hypothetical protein